MEPNALRIVVMLASSFILCALAVHVLKASAPAIGLVDAPGGRKDHSHVVPLVGGVSIFTALAITSSFLGIARASGYLFLALGIIAAVGVWDDLREIRPRIKFAVQIVAAAIMMWGAGIQLHSVGDLLGWRPIGLAMLTIPLTVFAVVGLVNALNMMDGMDGLAGSLALVAFAWYAAVAAGSGLEVQFEIALLLCGALAGFLLFNLRFPWQSQARVFLGDAGSLMLGFALAWFAVDLTQGLERTFPPIAALWVVLLPLADCVSLMTRRLRARRSPFVADRHHIHHYLRARGFTHGQTLGILVGLSTLFGAVGYFGWRAQLPEAVLFWPFFFIYFTYHFVIQRAWAKVEAQERGDTVEVKESVA